VSAAQAILHVQTRGPGLHEITDPVAAWVHGTGRAEGLLTLFLRHTSASLPIQENADPDVRADLAAFFRRLVPRADDPAMAYLTHRLEGADDMPAHIRAALLPVSLSIPVADGRMRLGTWQGVWLFEHRDRPHRREIAAHLA
jgi:secondary thiamine-phosphate synthase enzyme